MRVLVCGGRDYSDDEFLNRKLWRLHRDHPITAIIEGGANGADRFARWWANAAGVKCITVPAGWNKHGKAAGPIRNQRMIDEFRPDLIVAFPGGRGTADMVRRAESAKVRVIRADPRELSGHE